MSQLKHDFGELKAEFETLGYNKLDVKNFDN